jgi:hypothetical protein
VREKIPFSKEGNETRHLGFYNATLNALLQKNFYDDVIDRTHSSKHRKKKKKRIY